MTFSSHHPKAHPRSIPQKPEGQITRGKTAYNRLRRVDIFLMRYDPYLIRRNDGLYRDALFVDLGFGAEPITTLESAQRLRLFNPKLKILGVEIEPERVASGRPFVDEQTFFRLGGFNLPIEQDTKGQPETVRLIRAFNVLRQYDESAVADAYARLAHYVLPGGLLIEGTSDPLGRIWVANLLRRSDSSTAATEGTEWRAEGLLFSTNFRSGFELTAFQAVLPKNYIHRVVLNEPIYAFFDTWKQAQRETIAMKTWGIRQWFVASAERLAERGYAVNTQRKWLSKGYLLWQHR